jgi:ribosomal protein S24E
MKISSKNEKPLLSRTELLAKIAFDSATPRRSEIREKAAEAVKADESCVAVTGIKNDFGSKSASVTVHVYKSKEDLEKYESKVVKKRHSPKKNAEAAPEAAQ